MAQVNQWWLCNLLGGHARACLATSQTRSVSFCALTSLLTLFTGHFFRQISTHSTPRPKRTPWAFHPDTTFAQTSSLITRCQKEALSHARAERRLIPMLRLVREMKAEGVKPDLIIYNALLACIAQEGLPLEAWAVVDDMTAVGIPLDRQSYHNLLHVSLTLSDHAAH